MQKISIKLTLQKQALAFKEEHVPDPENCWPGQGPGKGAQKPLGHVQNWLHFLSLLPSQIKSK